MKNQNAHLYVTKGLMWTVAFSREKNPVVFSPHVKRILLVAQYFYSRAVYLLFDSVTAEMF
jgi:hypothetical protein